MSQDPDVTEDVEADDVEIEPGPSPYADPEIDTDGPQDEVPA